MWMQTNGWGNVVTLNYFNDKKCNEMECAYKMRVNINFKSTNSFSDVENIEII